MTGRKEQKPVGTEFKQQDDEENDVDDQLTVEENSLIAEDSTVVVPLADKAQLTRLIAAVAPGVRENQTLLEASYRKGMPMTKYTVQIISTAWNLTKMTLKRKKESTDPLQMMQSILGGEDDALREFLEEALDAKFDEEVGVSDNKAYSQGSDYHPTPRDYSLFVESGLLTSPTLLRLCAAVDQNATRRTRVLRQLAVAKHARLQDTLDQTASGLRIQEVQSKHVIARQECEVPEDASTGEIAAALTTTNQQLRLLHNALLALESKGVHDNGGGTFAGRKKTVRTVR